MILLILILVAAMAIYIRNDVKKLNDKRYNNDVYFKEKEDKK
jgi:hypothetical protein